MSNSCPLTSRTNRGLSAFFFYSSVVCSAWAADVDINVKFDPDANARKFVIVSPSTGFCADVPSICAGRNLHTAQVGVSFKADYLYSQVNAVQLRIPEAKTFELRNSNNRLPVTLRITGVGSRYNIAPATVMGLTGAKTTREGHEALWFGGSFLNPGAQSKCKSLYSGHLDMASLPSQYRYFWSGPPGASCGKTPKRGFSSFRNEFLDFSYELDMPDPYMMPQGHYAGMVTYTANRGGDFDPGFVVQPVGAAEFSVMVTLEVWHSLRAVLLDGTKAVLEPKGGWQAWTDKGRPPTRLGRDLKFLQQASAPFTMKLRCQYSLIGSCALKSAEGDTVKVDTLVSHAVGITNSAGTRVSREYLSPILPKKYFPGKEPFYGASFLHFEIPADRAAKMKSGILYSGTITVLWDVAV